MALANPFIYGEIVPPESFLDREPERAQLAHDLLDHSLQREYVLRETR